MEFNNNNEISETEEEKLLEKLQDKLEKEYQEYLENVMSKSKKEILESAYEITAKEEIKDEIVYFQLSAFEIKALLSRKNLLNDLYGDWLITDIQLGDVLVDSLIDSILKITNRFSKQQNEEELGN